MATRRFFFYGTLQPGCGTRMASWVASRTARSVEASVPGRLHAVAGGNGWYPALLRARSGRRASGTLCELRLGPGDLARLDRYEGREYRRALLPVRTTSGKLRHAQAYVWRGALPSGASEIRAGNFVRWLAQTRRTAFSTRRNGI